MYPLILVIPFPNYKLSNYIVLFHCYYFQNIAENVKKIANFLGKSLEDEEINSIIEYCSFQSMVKRKTVGLSDDEAIDGKGKGFFRKGDFSV